jgi:hypothetical protein
MPNLVDQAAAQALPELAQNNPVPDFNSAAPAPVVTDVQLAEQKKARQDKATFGTYAHAALRQDDFVMGLIANQAGPSTIDPTFYPTDPKVWKELTSGIPEEFHSQFYDAKSMAGALYTKGLIQDKMDDQLNLGDLGAMGNTLRFVGGFAMPGNLLMNLVSMGAGSAVSGGRALYRANAALRMADGLPNGVTRTAALASATEALQAAASKSSTLKGVATMAATGAGQNAMYEELRQKYGFEDDSSGVLHAALTGLAFTAPFAGVHALQMSRLRAAAGLERDVLHIIQRAQDHPEVPLTTEEHATLAKADEAQAYAHGVADGTIDPTTAKHPLDSHPSVADTSATSELSRDSDAGTPASAEHAGTPAPEGFGPMSVGAAQAGSTPSFGMDPVYMRNGRMDISATLNKSPNPVVQELGWSLVKDALGNSKAVAQGWSASEIKSNLVRRFGGDYHVTERQAMLSAQEKLGLNWRNRQETFAQIREAATKVARGGEVPPHLQAVTSEVQSIAAGMRKLYDRMLTEMKNAGVKGAENVESNPNFVNRVWRHDLIDKKVAKHGNRVYEMLGNSMRDPRAQALTSAEKAANGKSFLKAVQKLQYSNTLQNIDLLARDMPTLERELSHAGLTPTEIASVKDALFEHKASETDAGNAGNLKFRFKLDENYRERMPDGSMLGVSDLLENDSRLLVDKYLHNMGGHVALAQKGITSRADMDALLRKADQWHEENPGQMTGTQLADSKRLLMDMYDHTVGRPMSMQSFNKADRLVRALQAYSRSALLGQLGIAAAGELKNSAALAGWTSALAQLPTLGATIRAMKRGYQASDKLAKSIHELWAFASEYSSTYARKHEIEDYHSAEGRVQSLENFGNKASHVIDTVSGNRFFTSATREMSARFAIQKYADLASGSKALTEKLQDRMVANGVGRAQIKSVLEDLHQFTTRDGKRVTELDWEGWAQHDPSTLSAFQLLVERDVRDMIQAHDIGETMPWMHTTVGKIFGELRTFNLTGHAKQFLKNAHHRDATAASAAMFSIVGEGLAYALQQSMNTHDPKELAKKLTPEKIAAAIVARSNVLGMLPFGLDAAMYVSTGQHLSGTTNTDNRNLLTPPTAALLQKGFGGVMGMGAYVNPFTDHTLTRGEGKGMWGMLPGSNTYGSRYLIDWMTQGLPRQQPQQH